MTPEEDAICSLLEIECVCDLAYKYDLPTDEAEFWDQINYFVGVHPEATHNSRSSMLFDQPSPIIH